MLRSGTSRQINVVVEMHSFGCAMTSTVEQRCHQSGLRSRTPGGDGSDIPRSRIPWTRCQARPRSQSKNRLKSSRFQSSIGGHHRLPPEPRTPCRCTRDSEGTRVACCHKLGSGGRAVRSWMIAGPWPIQVSDCCFESVRFRGTNDCRIGRGNVGKPQIH